VDLGLTLAIDSAGSILSRPQLFHRALEPHSYPFPESVSRSYQALTASNVVTGSVDLGLTLDISTSGARLGGVRLGIARPGGTNQGFTTRAVDNPGPETVLLESRGFVYYHAAPPIYRSIRPGQTNQGFTFKAPDPEAHPPVERPRLVKGASSSSTKFGAVDLGLSLNIATEGTAKGAGRVRRGLEPHSTPELPNQSRTYFRLPRRWTSSVDLPLTLDISVSGQGRVIGRHLKAPPPQEFPEKPNISRTYFRLPQRHSGTVDLGLSINVSTSGTTQGIGRHLKAPPPQEFPQTPNLSRSYFRLPKRHPGAAGLQLTFGVVTAGTRKTTGSVTFPIVFNIGTEGSILGAGVVGHFDRPTPGGRSRATPGAGQFDRPTPGRQPV
jgi:hypothetical protein